MYYHKTSFQLLTFYHFVDIPQEEVDQVVRQHLQFTKDIGMKGRVYIGTEGISSTVTGNVGQIEAYKLFLKSSKYFHDARDIEVKANDVDGHEFDKMIVKERDEIVVLGEKVTAEEVEKYDQRISTEEFKKIIDEGKEDDYLILDMRNDYEYELGHFKGAVPAGTVNFREVPTLLEKYKKMADGRKIIWYCTGGIRCEKASVLMGKAGMDVAAIDGGVVKYTNKHNDGNWLGNLYTFDGRVSTQVGDESTHTTIGKCIHSQAPTDNCENCRYTNCNARMITDLGEHQRHMGFCSKGCVKDACETLLIKDVEWDDFRCPGNTTGNDKEYKILRSKVRQGLISESDAQRMVSDHLAGKLDGVDFRHEESQKEDVIYTD